ncbi:MAG: glycerol-3-phosphate 1-O-acyltransferase PlsY [Clostridia bacterium]|nr:glycerol-3-phosphate 1-O-acyltransferase PlsY [Clostridia bacterium]
MNILLQTMLPPAETFTFSPMLIAAGLAAALAAYLLGSICFAIPVGYLFTKKDIRTLGSGNAGMTNVLRNCGYGAAALTLIGDVGKAVAAVFLGQFLFETISAQNGLYGGYIAGLFVMLGHTYPLYHKFKGGKGVLTAVGMLLTLDPTSFLLGFTVFVVVFVLTRIISISSICAAAALPVIVGVLWSSRQNPDWIYATVMVSIIALFIIFNHRTNIARLLAGTEKQLTIPKRKK